MSNLIQVNFKGIEVRWLQEDEIVWFAAIDVCRAIGLKDAHKAIARVRAHQKGTKTFRTPGGNQELLAVSEPGLYSLVLRSNKPEAIEFQDWVTDEVLPSIRKTGGYQSKPMTQIQIMQMAVNHLAEHEQRLNHHDIRIDQVERLAIQASSHNSANTGFMTVRGFCNVKRIKLDIKQSSKFGKQCSALARKLGAEIRPTTDEMFGEVKSYPFEILETAFAEMSEAQTV